MISINLSPEETAALERAGREHTYPRDTQTMARLLIRDSLIGMGPLPLPGKNRSKWAGRRGRLVQR